MSAIPLSVVDAKLIGVRHSWRGSHRIAPMFLLGCCSRCFQPTIYVRADVVAAPLLPRICSDCDFDLLRARRDAGRANEGMVLTHWDHDGPRCGSPICTTLASPEMGPPAPERDAPK